MHNTVRVTGKSESNARYYAKTRHRIILRESELQPSTIEEIVDNLLELPLHASDKRVSRLQALYCELTGKELK